MFGTLNAIEFHVSNAEFACFENRQKQRMHCRKSVTQVRLFEHVCEFVRARFGRFTVRKPEYNLTKRKGHAN